MPHIFRGQHVNPERLTIEEDFYFQVASFCNRDSISREDLRNDLLPPNDQEPSIPSFLEDDNPAEPSLYFFKDIRFHSPDYLMSSRNSANVARTSESSRSSKTKRKCTELTAAILEAYNPLAGVSFSATFDWIGLYFAIRKGPLSIGADVITIRAARSLSSSNAVNSVHFLFVFEDWEDLILSKKSSNSNPKSTRASFRPMQPALQSTWGVGRRSRSETRISP